MSFLINPHVFAAGVVPVANLIDDGTFDGTGDWTLAASSGSPPAISGGQLAFTPGASVPVAYQVANETLVAGESIYYEITVANRIAGTVTLQAGRSAGSPPTGGTLLRNNTANGTFSGVVNITTVSGQIIAISGASSTANMLIDNVVVKKALQNLTPTTASVAEDVSIGATVLTPTRGRSGSAFSLTVNASGKFAIDPSTGVVTVAGGLDYETATSHAITIRETNAAYPNSPRDTNVTITVTNVFDGTPGPELSPDPGFDTSGLWTFTGGAVVTGSYVEIPPSGSAAILFAGDFEQGATYRFTFTIDATNFAQILIAGTSAVTLGSGPFVSPGTYTAEFKLTSAPGSPPNQMRIDAFVGYCRLSSLSVKKVTFP